MVSTNIRAAICFKGKHGATHQYAEWIADATGFPVFDLRDQSPDLNQYDLLILGSAVYVGHFYIMDWLKAHWSAIRDKHLILFTVSGTAPDHPDIQTYLRSNLTPEMLERMEYVPLRGKLKLQDLNWFLRNMLKWVGRVTKDKEAGKRMTEGFDFVEKKNIDPVLETIEELSAAFV